MLRTFSVPWCSQVQLIDHSDSDGNIRAGLGVPVNFPVVPGHEVVGDVVAVHPSVRDYKVGDRVGAPMQRNYCGECRHCRSGQLMGCDKLFTTLTGA